MATYNNGSVVQCMRQYEMFANSLNLVKNNEEKNMIIKQLTKLEMKIIELTNEVYEEEYKKTALNLPYDSQKFNHAVAAIYVRNSYGGFDYFEGNNSHFRTFSYPENIRNSKISLYNMYFTSREGQSLDSVFGKNATDKTLKNYVCGKKSSILFFIAIKPIR